jgi:hypothetical protein
MNVKQINSLLTSAALACCAGAALIVAGGLLIPLDWAAESRGLSTAIHLPTSLPSTFTIDSADEALWSRPLRASLSDAAPGADGSNQTFAPTANPQSLTLVGTIGDSLALIRLADGSVVARGVGDEVGGAGRVLGISSKGVEMWVNGQRVLLAKPQPATSTGVLLEKAS